MPSKSAQCMTWRAFVNINNNNNDSRLSYGKCVGGGGKSCMPVHDRHMCDMAMKYGEYFREELRGLRNDLKLYKPRIKVTNTVVKMAGRRFDAAILKGNLTYHAISITDIFKYTRVLNSLLFMIHGEIITIYLVDPVRTQGRISKTFHF